MTRPGPKPKPLTLNGLEIDLLGKLDRVTDRRGILMHRTDARDRLQRLGLVESVSTARMGDVISRSKYWRLTAAGREAINSRRTEDDRT